MGIDCIVKSIKSLIGPVYRKVVPYSVPDKSSAELYYWKKQYEQDGGKFKNSWYQKTMLAMAGEGDETFLHDKIVADFGCGPRGSLARLSQFAAQNGYFLAEIAGRPLIFKG